jgi:hypothetical protein
MGTTGGELQTVFDRFMNQWLTCATNEVDTDNDGVPDTSVPLDTNGDDWPDQSWGMRLPVIDCPSNNVSPCSTLVGAVNVTMLWILRNTSPDYSDTPLYMDNWTCEVDGLVSITAMEQALGRPVSSARNGDLTEEQRLACWQDFVSEFNLMTWNDVPISDLAPSEIQKTMFFLPECEVDIGGVTGGQNFSILAKVPVLVD